MIMYRLAVFIKRYHAHRTVIGRICPVDIACKTAAEQRMKQSGIKLHTVFFCAALDLYAAERLFPLIMGFGFRLVKCHVGRFRHKVTAGIFNRSV